MATMPTAPAHAKPARRQHMWVLVLIAAACGLEVCATWTGIGARSDFPVIRLPYDIARIPTDFCLMVCMEAYAGYGLYIWLTAPGRRSGPFAMWSAVVAIVFSLTGQVAYHVTGAAAAVPPWLVGFVSALPVIALLLVAILIHLVRLDLEEEAGVKEAARKAEMRAAEAAAAADERTLLRAELEAARGALEPLRAELGIVQRDLAESVTRAETLAAKLDALKPRKRAAKPSKGKREIVHDDVTIEFRAFELLRDNPELRAPRKGAELGRRLEASTVTGYRLHKRLIVDGQLVQPFTESITDRSADQSGDPS